MKLRTATALTVILISSLAQAQIGTQFCGNNPGVPPIVQPPVRPAPSYFLGVRVSTVEVEAYGRAKPVYNGGVQAMVAPGAGQAVYGQRINYVVPNSPAANAGLEPGDIILDANGFPMDNSNDLQQAIDTSQGRMEMKVIDSRTGKMMWVNVNTDRQNTAPMMMTNLPRPTRASKINVGQTPQVGRPFKSLPQTRPQTNTIRPQPWGGQPNSVTRGPIRRGGR